MSRFFWYIQDGKEMAIDIERVVMVREHSRVPYSVTVFLEGNWETVLYDVTADTFMINLKLEGAK